MSRSSWGHTLRCLVPPVTITIAVSVAGLFVVRRFVPAAELRAVNDVAGNFLQTLGTIYAVLLAFVVFVVWQQFNDARVQVEREANNLLDLHRTAAGLPAAEAAKLHEIVQRYADEVVSAEWTAMQRGDHRGLDAGWTVLEEMSDAVRSCSPHSDVQLAHVGDLLQRLDDLSDARSDRIASSMLRVPRAMRLLLWLGAASTIGSLYLFAVDSLAIHILMVGVLSGAISHILYLINDLDDTFGGDFVVSPAPFERIRRHARRS